MRIYKCVDYINMLIIFLLIANQRLSPSFQYVHCLQKRSSSHVQCSVMSITTYRRFVFSSAETNRITISYLHTSQSQNPIGSGTMHAYTHKKSICCLVPSFVWSLFYSNYCIFVILFFKLYQFDRKLANPYEKGSPNEQAFVYAVFLMFENLPFPTLH